MRKSNARAILLSLMMATGVLLPTSASAQFDWLHGLFGKGEDTNGIQPEEESELYDVMIPNLEEFTESENYEGGLFSKGANSNGTGLFNQGFGETPTGISIGQFQENGEAPLGDGLLFMLLGGVGYAVLKKKKGESNQ